MAGRAASPPWKEALISHLCQPNCKHKAHWINIPKMRPGWRIRRRTQHPLDHHIRDTPAPSTCNWMEISTEGPPSIKLTHAYHFNLLACHPDSSNVRNSPSQTGSFALCMVEQVLSAKNLMLTNVPHPQCQIYLPCWPPCKWHGTVKHYTSMELSNITLARKIKITSLLVPFIQTHHVELI